MWPQRGEDRRHAQFLGAATQSLMHLMERVDEEGNTVKGRYDTQPIRSLFGEGAFNSPRSAPWEGVLRNSRPDGDIATGLHQA